MYNNLATTQVKGTGLSGYVQRSKAAVQSSDLSHFRSHHIGDDDEPVTEMINPLVRRRTKEENETLARRLAVHKAYRQVHLKVLAYQQERLGKGVEKDVVQRECEEYYRSLLAVTEEEIGKEQKAIQRKTAEQFAEAFGVKPSEFSPFDLAKKEEVRRQQEEEELRKKERELADRIKRLKEEEGGGGGV